MNKLYIGLLYVRIIGNVRRSAQPAQMVPKMRTISKPKRDNRMMNGHVTENDCVNALRVYRVLEQR